MSITLLMLVAVVIGSAIVGSFLNVCIYRFPLMYQTSEKIDLCLPSSHCPHCKTPLKAWMNIPLISFLFLKGRCYFCKHKIEFNYFLTEIVAVLLGLLLYCYDGFTWQAGALFFLFCGLYVLSVIDLKTRLLPDEIVYVLMWLGLAVSTRTLFVSPAQAIVGVLVGYLFLWIISKLFFLIRGKEGMGLGDCKMLGMIGAWTGPIPLLSVVLIATVLALIISVYLLVRKKITANTWIPFGPFLALGGCLTMLFGNYFI